MDFVPEHFNEYREPFVGGGSVFLHLLNTRPKMKFWINDINYDLMAFWYTLRDYGKELTDTLLKIKEENLDGKNLYYKLKNQNINKLETFDRGVRFFVLNRITYSGLVDAGGYSKESFKKRFTQNSIDNLIQVSPKMKNVKITSEDYEQMLRTPGKEVFMFLDPPYETKKSSKLYGKGGKNGIDFNNERLLKELTECRHIWLLTYDKTERIYNDYSRFAAVDEKIVQYCTNKGENGQARKGNELFIHNYEIERNEQVYLNSS